MERTSEAALVPEVNPLAERVRLLQRIMAAEGDERRLLFEVDALTAEVEMHKRIGDEHKRIADASYVKFQRTQATLIDTMRELSACIRERAKKDGRR